jgi:hypothetical protein
MNKGRIRSSQVITTFGPGAMVDLPDASVIIAGLDNWHYETGNIPTIEEPRLVAKLRRILGVADLTLRLPPAANEREQGFHPDVVGWRFPEWFIVQQTAGVGQGYRRRRLVHLNRLDGMKYRDERGKKQEVVPVRFVRACRKGHVGDIDWIAFVHGAQGLCSRDLWLEERGTSGDLSEVWVVCDCGKDRPMAQAARVDLRALGSCNGTQPWLGPGPKEQCGEPNRLLIRSASNAYFPQLMSVISIPDTMNPVDDVVRSLWDDFLSDAETLEDLIKIRKKPTVALRLEGIDDGVVFASIGRVRAGDTGSEKPVKEVEFDALTEAREEIGSDNPEGDFYAKALPEAEWNAPWMKGIEKIVLVHRLREVIAQVGFTRFEAAGPDFQGELALDVKRAPIGVDTSWLPAVENRGEGIFLQIRDDAVAQWLKEPTVKGRGLRLTAGFELWKAEREAKYLEFPGMPYYLLHSLSHLLVTAISLECGYPSSSLRERIYAADGRYGILIYTGSSDSEGTLGGLVMAGREIKRHFKRALDSGSLCSNDPVCAYHVPTPQDQPLLGAACHGCLLIAETSCEQRNDYLDRALVVATVENLGAEFFK